MATDVVQASQREPDVRMYQHVRSAIVHVMACGITNKRFTCGNQLIKDYQLVAEISFLDLRKCKRCALARPIKNLDALSALQKQQELEEPGYPGSWQVLAQDQLCDDFVIFRSTR